MTDIVEGNKLIAEFMGEGWWQVWKKKEDGGYKPYWADIYKSEQKCQEAMDKYFIDQMAGESLSEMAQHKEKYAPKFICKEYHLSWDLLMPAYRKITEIGLWMMTHGHDKLWLEKSKEIKYAILNEETPEKAAILISQLINWYNNQNK